MGEFEKQVMADLEKAYAEAVEKAWRVLIVDPDKVENDRTRAERQSSGD